MNFLNKFLYLPTMLLLLVVSEAQPDNPRVSSLFKYERELTTARDNYSQCARHATFIALRSVGVDLTYERIKEIVPVSQDGSTTLDVVHNALVSQGVNVHAVKVDCNVQELKKYLPGIILVKTLNQFFDIDHVVFAEFDTDSNTFTVYDPQISPTPLTVPVKLMEDNCKGIVLSLQKY